MILKKIDASKYEDVKILKSKLLKSDSDPQKFLIKKELQRLEAGLKGEEQAAYFIDFNLADSANYIVLHDLRFEIDGLTAQIDHLLINRGFGAILVETKNTDAEVTINSDNTMRYLYRNGKSYNQPNPMAQSQRHEEVLKRIFKKLGISINMRSFVVFLPELKITNASLPDGFVRADNFLKVMMDDIVTVSSVIGAFTKLIVNKIPTKDELVVAGNKLIAEHKPISIDYDRKYATKSKIEHQVAVQIKQLDNPKERMAEEQNREKFKNIVQAKKYMGNEMVSLACIKCDTEQRCSKAKFMKELLFCKNCKN